MVEQEFAGTLKVMERDGNILSDVVKQAMSLGYTEPDPRDDLSGIETVQILTYAARAMQLALADGPGYSSGLLNAVSTRQPGLVVLTGGRPDVHHVVG